MAEKRIILTGGGTAGHVTPNIALMPELEKRGYEIIYIGSKDGMEKDLMANFDVPYYGISSGKLRRYFDLKNFTDPFRILNGYRESKKLLKELKPDVVFSKGGFVTVPLVKAATGKGIPCVLHESDMSPGLANRLCIKSADVICTNFPETVKHLPEGKAQVKATVDYYMQNAARMLTMLKALGFECYGGENAPYIWMRTPNGMGSWQFFESLLYGAQVVCTPGVGFGPSGEGYVRFTAFGSHERTEEALQRIKDWSK